MDGTDRRYESPAQTRAPDDAMARASQAAALLASMHARGVTVWVEDGRLRYRSEKGLVGPADIDALRACKAELVDLLERESFWTSVPLEPRAQNSRVLLTPIQQLVWKFYVSSGGAPQVRFSSVAFRISGALSVDLLRRCFATLVARHEALRTRIVCVDGVPTQRFDGLEGWELEVVDISRQSLPLPQQTAQALIDELTEQKVDLCVGPLFAARVVKVSAADHFLVISLDHTISDFVTKKILKEELWILYEQYVQGRAAALPAISIHQGDYAVWLNKMYPLWQRRHSAYWDRRLGGAHSVQYPADSGQAESRAPVSTLLHVRFGGQLTKGLDNVARQEKVLPALVLLAVYVAVVARWLNQRDLTVAVVDNGRHRPELVNTIGWLATHLQLRIELTGEETFRDLVAGVNREFCAASEHQDYNWVLLSNPELLTNLYFNWRTTDPAERRVNDSSDIRIRTLPTRRPDVPMKWGIFFQHDADELTATLTYRSDLFKSSTADRFGRNLHAFSEAITYDPAICVQAVPLETGS